MPAAWSYAEPEASVSKKPAVWAWNPYNQYKADEQAAKMKADGVKAQIDALLSDCDLAQVNGYELARVAPGQTKSFDTTGLLRFCDTLRRTENGDMAEAIMGFFKKGERAGYFRIAALRERPTDG